MARPAFRFAPSPNGALHLGHAYSALLNERMARESGGRFLVRVEDIDILRCPRSLADAALADLAWLGLEWEEPVFFQSAHFGDYRAAQERLRAEELLYPCFCSRQDIARTAVMKDPEGQPFYPGTCKTLTSGERAVRLGQGAAHSWRIDMEKALARIGRPLTFVDGTVHTAAPEAWGDVILARKDIGTSYHVACVTDDARQGITHVVRGKDLYLQTAIHRVLQELLGLPEPQYHHHDLIGDEAGRKLSKSARDRSLKSLRDSGVAAAEIRRELGF